MHPRDQTIFALSSGRPPSAISMVRLSGPKAGLALTALAGKIPMPRVATRVLLRDGPNGLRIVGLDVLLQPFQTAEIRVIARTDRLAAHDRNFR